MSKCSKPFTRIGICAIILIFCLPPSICISQEDSTTSVGELYDKFKRDTRTILTDSIKYYGNLSELSDLKYKVEYAMYQVDNVKHRRNTFYWQLLASKIIFFIVVLIVLCGLFFSGIQFYYSTKPVTLPTNNNGEADVVNSPKPTEIELSITNGVKIKSSIIGLLILLTSIAFFYLYLIHVYPVNEKNIDHIEQVKIESITPVQNKT